MIEIIFFAGVAALVLARLYQVLGRKTGAERPSQPLPERAPDADVAAAPLPAEPSLPRYDGPGAVGISAIAAAEGGFDPDAFVEGSKVAYDMIVTGYAKGDLDALRPLLSDEAFDAYRSSIMARPAEGFVPVELIRILNARIVEAELSGSEARITVAFSAELSNGTNGMAVTNELWTFERTVGARDPNWKLTAVDAVT